MDVEGRAAATSWYPLRGMLGPGKRSGGLSSGGVTSSPMLPLSAIFMAFAFCCCCCCWCCKSELKWEIPISSKLLFLRLEPVPLRPCRKELERLSRMSSTTRKEFERPRKSVMIVGLSGSDKELAFVVDNGGARGCVKLAPIPDPRLLATPCAWIRAWEQKLMFDLRRLLCRSKVFCAENGDGRTKYLKIYVFLLPRKSNKIK